MSWLGMTSENEPLRAMPSLMDTFCGLLEAKLRYAPDEHDLVVMNHKFGIKEADGTKTGVQSTLVAYGDEKYTAMARTVGLPAAISAQLILDGKLDRSHSGAIMPTERDVYRPVLRELAREGIKLKDTEIIM